MSRFIYIIFALLIFTHCSIDNKSGIWLDKNKPNSKIELSKINFDKKLTYVEFRENVVLYAKKSRYPKIIKNND